jgi:predicted nucleic acid-binding protein
VGPLDSVLSGRLYLDAQIFIYTVERDPVYASTLARLWAKSDSGDFALVTSELSILECLTGAYRSKNPTLLAQYEEALASTSIETVPIGQDILRLGARLRADTPSLRTPDAIHLATAMTATCQGFLTNDRRLRSLPGLICHQLEEFTGI